MVLIGLISIAVVLKALGCRVSSLSTPATSRWCRPGLVALRCALGLRRLAWPRLPRFGGGMGS